MIKPGISNNKDEGVKQCLLQFLPTPQGVTATTAVLLDVLSWWVTVSIRWAFLSSDEKDPEQENKKLLFASSIINKHSKNSVY